VKFKIGDANNQPKDPIKEIELRVNKMFEIGDWVECSQEDFEQHFTDFKNLIALVKEYRVEILDLRNYAPLPKSIEEIESKIFGSNEGE